MNRRLIFLLLAIIWTSTIYAFDEKWERRLIALEAADCGSEAFRDLLVEEIEASWQWVPEGFIEKNFRDLVVKRYPTFATVSFQSNDRFLRPGLFAYPWIFPEETRHVFALVENLNQKNKFVFGEIGSEAFQLQDQPGFYFYWSDRNYLNAEKTIQVNGVALYPLSPNLSRKALVFLGQGLDWLHKVENQQLWIGQSIPGKETKWMLVDSEQNPAMKFVNGHLSSAIQSGIVSLASQGISESDSSGSITKIPPEYFTKKLKYKSAFQPDRLFELSPREAAIAIVDSHRSDEHHQYFQMVVPERLSKLPPDSGQLEIFYEEHYWDPWWVLDYSKDRPSILYRGSSDARWSVEYWPQSRTRWFLETISWLDEIRTTYNPAFGFVSNDSHLGADGLPLMELLVVANKKIAFDYPPTHAQNLHDRWKGPYDRGKAATLAHALWEWTLKHMEKTNYEEKAKKHADPDPETTIVEQFIQNQPVSLQLVREAIPIVSEDQLQRLIKKIGAADEFEKKVLLWTETRFANPNDPKDQEKKAIFLDCTRERQLLHSGLRLRPMLVDWIRRRSIENDLDALQSLLDSKQEKYDVESWARKRIKEISKQ